MKRKPNSMLKQIDGEYLILPLSDHNISVDVILKTNEVGAFIYELLGGGISQEKLLDSILEEYEVSREQAKKDLEAFLNQMKNKGLLDD